MQLSIEQQFTRQSQIRIVQNCQNIESLKTVTLQLIDSYFSLKTLVEMQMKENLTKDFNEVHKLVDDVRQQLRDDGFTIQDDAPF